MRTGVSQEFRQLIVEPVVVGLDARAEAVVGGADIEGVVETDCCTRIASQDAANPGRRTAYEPGHAAIGLHAVGALLDMVIDEQR